MRTVIISMAIAGCGCGVIDPPPNPDYYGPARKVYYGTMEGGGRSVGVGCGLSHFLDPKPTTPPPAGTLVCVFDNGKEGHEFARYLVQCPRKITPLPPCE